MDKYIIIVHSTTYFVCERGTRFVLCQDADEATPLSNSQAHVEAGRLQNAGYRTCVIPAPKPNKGVLNA